MPEPPPRHDAQQVADALAAVTPDSRRADAARLDTLFRQATGWRPCLWPSGVIGYGSYRYCYDSGHSGISLATGFAPRKARMVLHIMPGYTDFGTLLARLGPHKQGKGCVYLGPLHKLDLDVMSALVRAGLDDLAQRWPISPS